ncbi:hypothetical protein HYH03_016973 [Edaphochlamys debaryana]|uniref:PAS domain-containing protein n=1 Tax=Edaphochlamys debaryana TaxID=47281 RepID=A0A835XK07_9CHLO|nr:hypothetical protein HYH03_016973 [Edaphochlamys debaryana]|eukprot:KAG2484238.1 hypothetical protein HYH03_016973 [Edaphochlamys debaryana]
MDKDRENDDASSQRSGGTTGTSGAGSETASSQKSDNKFLKRRDRSHDHDDEGDLLDRQRNIQDGIFACMYTLVRQSALSSWKFAVLKIVLEFLMFFIVTFNTQNPHWEINTSNPVWQVIRWTVWRSPVARLYGYDTYIIVLYVMEALVLMALLGLLWLTMAMRKQEQSKGLRIAALCLYVVYDIMFMMCYASFFDYFVFTADCAFTTSSDQHHMYFEGVKCLQMPHLMHMAIALLAAAVFLCITALMVIASSDLNPVSMGFLASPAVYPRLKILGAKAVYVTSAACLEAIPNIQCVVSCICVVLITWWNFRTMPFYRNIVNIVWSSNWVGVLYAAIILCILVFQKDHDEVVQEQYTNYVLYGIFPVVIGSWAVVGLHIWWRMRPAQKFKDLEPNTKLGKIHKFESAADVEVLARVMRHFDEDGLVTESAAALGEVVIKAGLQAFPDSAPLTILFSNFLLEVRKDGPASRTQLQIASRRQPGFVERYQIFCTNEASKRLKDSQEGGMDLQAYIEFKRNYRAALRVHKEALMLQTHLWELCLKPRLKVTDIDSAMNAVEAAAGRAHQVYKRVLERYPTNGKLLRCYGKFLEDIRHDPVGAARVYGEANRNGGAEALLALNLDMTAGVQGAGSRPDFLTSMSLEDPVIVINAEGTIMMVSQAVQGLFGYPKAELEGAAVSLLMPQPFSQRHPSYLQRYVATGEARMLDSVREVVAMHKDRYVFPMSLCVTKLSGVGTDSIFLAVARPLPPNANVMRAWMAPNGVFLCGDQSFASLVGMPEGELVGRTLSALVVDNGDGESVTADALLEQCRDASYVQLAGGALSFRLRLLHRYLDPVPCEVAVTSAGTDAQRILVLNCRRTDGLSGNIMVVDTRMKIRFAAAGVASMLGYGMRKLTTMQLDQLLPAPYNTLHARWLKDPPMVVPPTSCRAGMTVSLLNDSSTPVPVRLMVKCNMSDASNSMGTYHIVQIDRAAPGEDLDEKRLVLTADLNGRVRHISRPASELFGFPAREVMGRNLCDFVDIFAEWRERNGESQLSLLFLALLDKEQETPGSSWRVRVQEPTPSGGRLPDLAGGGAAGGGKAPVSRSACMQVEVSDETHLGDGQAHDDNDPHATGHTSHDHDDALSTASSGILATHIHVVLWRRDLLTGVLELDGDMVVRRASVMAGLISGVPSASMVKKPLYHFLDLPRGPDTKWEDLAAAGQKHKKSAMKSGAVRGTVSPVIPLIGPHPDMGNMRLLLQGVTTLAPGGKAKTTVMLHPDTAFTGARANLMRVLRLDGSGEADARGARSGRRPTSAATTATHIDADKGRGEGREHKGGDRSADEGAGSRDRDAGDDEEKGQGQGEESGDEGNVSEDSGPRAQDERPDSPATHEAAALHRQATSRSDFVAQWVRTLTNKNSGALERPGSTDGGGGGPAAAPPPQHSRSGVSDRSAAGILALPLSKKASGLDSQPQQAAAQGSRRRDKAGATALSGIPEDAPLDEADMGLGPGRSPGGDGGPEDKDGAKWEKASEGGDSSADGSQSASGISSVTGGDASSVSEFMVDARRGRLLKALNKVILGAYLTTPLQRLRYHSYVLLLAMLITHAVCYVLLLRTLEGERVSVYMVDRQAQAMDRSQLILWRAMMGSYCERKNVTDKSSACSNNMQYTLDKLTENIKVMEAFHQGVYLGIEKQQKLEPEVYSIWTEKALPYSIFLDTHPRMVMNDTAGVWQLGNRFIAAARETLYYLPRLKDTYKFHRTSDFLITNGLGPLFQGYAASLELLVTAAWESIGRLRTQMLALLIIEALIIQLAATIYEWILVDRLERARVLGILAMLGLPGPVLRALATKEVKIVDDSDDEDDDRDELEEDEQGGGGKEAAKPKAQGGGDTAPSAHIAANPGHGSGGEGASAAKPSAHIQEEDDEEPMPVGKFAAAAAGDGPVKALTGLPAGGSGSGRLVFAAGTKDEQDLTAAGGAGLGKKRSGGLLQRLRGRSGKAHAHRRTGGMVTVGGRVLVRSYGTIARFMIPFVMWNAAVIAVYAVSLVLLAGMQQPLASLNMASHVIFRYNRLRAYAFGLVSQDTAADQARWRAPLMYELDLFESEYDTMLYGGRALSQVNSVDKTVVPAATFDSVNVADAFFRQKSCYRFNTSLCFKPGEKYYTITHNGLDGMVRRVIQELRLLTLDADVDVRYNASRYDYIHMVGGRDCLEGLQTAAQIFVNYSITKYEEVRQLHMILLAVTVVLAFLYVTMLLWPHLAKVVADATRQSAMLSLVPPEVDVRAHVRAVLRRVTAGGRPKGRGQVAPS